MNFGIGRALENLSQTQLHLLSRLDDREATKNGLLRRNGVHGSDSQDHDGRCFQTADVPSADFHHSNTYPACEPYVQGKFALIRISLGLLNSF